MEARIPALVLLLAAGLSAEPPRVAPPSEALLARVEAKHREAVRAFYRKSVDIQGVPVLASAAVEDAALLRAHELVSRVLEGRPDVLKAMADFGTRLLIIGKDEVYTELPEYRDTPDPAFWNERVRGTGGDDVTSFGEENLLGLPGDRYDDMSVAVHEFAHTIDAILTRMDPGWQRELQALHARARRNRLFEGSYAATNAAEHWAEAVTMYFDCERPNNWNHGPVATREALARYAPETYAFVKRTLRLAPEQGWRYRPLRLQPSVTAPPAALRADPAYAKYTCAREFPVLGTARASDAALLRANETIRRLFAYRHDLLKGLLAEGYRLVVLGPGEALHALPEYRGTAREAGADDLRYVDDDPVRKLLVVPEENVLGQPGDPFAGECATISAFARAMLVLARRPVDPAFERRTERQQYELGVRRMDLRFARELQAAFARASRRGLWKGTPADRDRAAYWVSGVTAYFDAGGDGHCPLGAERPVTTRAALKAHDPALYRLVDATLAYRGRVDWRCRPAR